VATADTYHGACRHAARRTGSGNRLSSARSDRGRAVPSAASGDRSMGGTARRPQDARRCDKHWS